MSSSRECSELLNQRPVTSFTERPSFSQTCSMLSRYLKAKGSFGDLSLGLTCTAEADSEGTFADPYQPTTMNLFPCEVSSKDMKAKDLFTSQSCLPSSPPKENSKMTIDSISAYQEPQTAQMTIFYAGQVMVFNEFPADKAKDVMNLASRESAKSYLQNSNQSVSGPNLVKNQTESKSLVPPNLNQVPNHGKSLTQECVQPSSTRIASDLPIARRASLHRFLEKRKDRITARAPYQINEQKDTAVSKPTENRSWLGLAAHHLPS